MRRMLQIVGWVGLVAAFGIGYFKPWIGVVIFCLSAILLLGLDEDAYKGIPTYLTQQEDSEPVEIGSSGRHVTTVIQLVLLVVALIAFAFRS